MGNGVEACASYDIAQTVPAGGIVRWGWHEVTKGTGGEATVTCTFHNARAIAKASFTVTR